jgi:hypothetical protein
MSLPSGRWFLCSTCQWCYFEGHGPLPPEHRPFIGPMPEGQEDDFCSGKLAPMPRRVRRALSKVDAKRLSITR